MSRIIPAPTKRRDDDPLRWRIRRVDPATYYREGYRGSDTRLPWVIEVKNLLDPEPEYSLYASEETQEKCVRRLAQVQRSYFGYGARIDRTGD